MFDTYYQFTKFYQEHHTFPEDTDYWITNWFYYLKRGEIPPFTPSHVETFDAYPLRYLVTELGMWALVDLNWTKKLAEILKGKKVLEIMAGKGWLAKALNTHGIEVIATDNHSWHENVQPVYPVINLNAKKAIEIEHDIILVSWPPMNPDLVKALPETDLIYIGESYGGCTATNEFFERFKVESQFYIPQWNGIHDYVMVGHFR